MWKWHVPEEQLGPPGLSLRPVGSEQLSSQLSRSPILLSCHLPCMTLKQWDDLYIWVLWKSVLILQYSETLIFLSFLPKMLFLKIQLIPERVPLLIANLILAGELSSFPLGWRWVKSISDNILDVAAWGLGVP